MSETSMFPVDIKLLCICVDWPGNLAMYHWRMMDHRFSKYFIQGGFGIIANLDDSSFPF